MGGACGLGIAPGAGMVGVVVVGVAVVFDGVHGAEGGAEEEGRMVESSPTPRGPGP